MAIKIYIYNIEDEIFKDGTFTRESLDVIEKEALIVKRALEMVEEKKYKPGDFVQFVFGGPGPDITWAIVLEDMGDKVKVYEPFFETEVDIKNDNRLCLITKKETLDGCIGHSRRGDLNIREELIKARKKYGIERGNEQC